MQHLLWGLSRTRSFLHGLQEAGANHCSYLWLQRWEWLATAKGPRTDTTCRPIHLKGTTEEGIVTEHQLLVLLHLVTHWPHCYHYQTLQAVPTHLISVTSQDPATRSTLYNNSYVG